MYKGMEKLLYYRVYVISLDSEEAGGTVFDYLD